MMGSTGGAPPAGGMGSSGTGNSGTGSSGTGGMPQSGSSGSGGMGASGSGGGQPDPPGCNPRDCDRPLLGEACCTDDDECGVRLLISCNAR
jgi:hypothetical protein